VAVLPFEAYRLLGHGGAGTELVGLDKGAAGELEAGEPRGKAQFSILDEVPACPPSATDSRARVKRPSEAP
jgi:hypothetical protein